MKRPEILAPAGDFTCLQAAVDAGADAVYFGLGTFNMRARSGVNFKAEDLPEIARRCGKVKRYLALNAIMFEGEVEEVERTIVAAKPYVDAFIVSDWGVISLCRRHGAQCVAESGRCFMSQDVFGKSACRGECVQPCRRRFRVQAVDLYVDKEGNPVHEAKTAFEVEPHTVLSAKDLCSIGFVDRLMAAGIASFKIEGRARNANYVKTCVEAYREAVDAVVAGMYGHGLVARLRSKLETVFHHEFADGMYFGRPGADQFADSEDSLATTVKRHVGIVVDYFLKAGIAQVKIQDHEIHPGDEIQVHGPTTGVVELVLGELRRDEESPAVGEKGTWVTFRCPRCRVGDKVFFVEHR